MSTRRTLVCRSFAAALAATAVAAPGASAMPVRDGIDEQPAFTTAALDRPAPDGRASAVSRAAGSPSGDGRGGSWWTVALGVGAGGALAAGAAGAAGRRRSAGRAHVAA